jgi:hypothetical protein
VGGFQLEDLRARGFIPSGCAREEEARGEEEARAGGGGRARGEGSARGGRRKGAKRIFWRDRVDLAAAGDDGARLVQRARAASFCLGARAGAVAETFDDTSFSLHLIPAT